MDFVNFLVKLLGPRAVIAGSKCSKCSKVLLEESDKVWVLRRLYCKPCADWTDEYLNEIQMHEGGYDCGGGVL